MLAGYLTGQKARGITQRGKQLHFLTMSLKEKQKEAHNLMSQLLVEVRRQKELMDSTQIDDEGKSKQRERASYISGANMVT